MAIQFPNSPGIGSVFTDTDAGFSYEWTGVVWKSFTPAAANNIKELDDISSSFNNSTTASKKTQKNSSKSTYLVKPGDSLWSISNKLTGISVQNLKEWNDIWDNHLKPGMTLIISN